MCGASRRPVRETSGGSVGQTTARSVCEAGGRPARPRQALSVHAPSRPRVVPRRAKRDGVPETKWANPASGAAEQPTTGSSGRGVRPEPESGPQVAPALLSPSRPLVAAFGASARRERNRRRPRSLPRWSERVPEPRRAQPARTTWEPLPSRRQRKQRARAAPEETGRRALAREQPQARAPASADASRPEVRVPGLPAASGRAWTRLLPGFRDRARHARAGASRDRRSPARSR